VSWIRDIGVKIDLMFNARERAKNLGTLDADDRAKQYPLKTIDEVITAVNLALTKARRCERLSDEKDAIILKLERKIGRDRVVIAALTSILTPLVWEGFKALLAHLVR
jgi:hypothetical protein